MKNQYRGCCFEFPTLISTLRSSLKKTKQERDPQQTAQRVYSTPCECGRSYISETGRPLAVRLREHRHNLKENLLEKSKLAQHVFKGSHIVTKDVARILKIKSTSGIGNMKTKT
jgi:hypothetical protein